MHLVLNPSTLSDSKVMFIYCLTHNIHSIYQILQNLGSVGENKLILNKYICSKLRKQTEITYELYVLWLKDAYKNELRLMVEVGRRAEIEALYCHGFDFLGKYIARKIVQSAYV